MISLGLYGGFQTSSSSVGMMGSFLNSEPRETFKDHLGQGQLFSLQMGTTDLAREGYMTTTPYQVPVHCLLHCTTLSYIAYDLLINMLMIECG